MMWNLDDRWHLLYALTGFAIVMTELGPADRAVRLLAAQTAARETYGNRISPRRQVAYDVAVAKVRTTLGDEAFSAAWAAGMALSLHDAVAEILEQ